MDLANLESIVDERSRAIVLTNPSNPCGSVFTAEHIKEILHGEMVVLRSTGTVDQTLCALRFAQLAVFLFFFSFLFFSFLFFSFLFFSCLIMVSVTFFTLFSFSLLSLSTQVAERLRLPIIADEVYANMTFTGVPFHSIASLSVNVRRDVKLFKFLFTRFPLIYLLLLHLSLSLSLLSYVPFFFMQVPVLSCGGIAKRFVVPGWRLGWVLIHDRHNAFKATVSSDFNCKRNGYE